MREHSFFRYCKYKTLQYVLNTVTKKRRNKLSAYIDLQEKTNCTGNISDKKGFLK